MDLDSWVRQRAMPMMAPDAVSLNFAAELAPAFPPQQLHASTISEDQSRHHGSPGLSRLSAQVRKESWGGEDAGEEGGGGGLMIRMPQVVTVDYASLRGWRTLCRTVADSIPGFFRASRDPNRLFTFPPFVTSSCFTISYGAPLQGNLVRAHAHVELASLFTRTTSKRAAFSERIKTRMNVLGTLLCSSRAYSREIWLGHGGTHSDLLTELSRRGWTYRGSNSSVRQHLFERDQTGGATSAG